MLEYITIQEGATMFEILVLVALTVPISLIALLEISREKSHK